jgi:hypothetical protein
VPKPVIACALILIALATVALGARAIVPRMGDAMARHIGAVAAAMPSLAAPDAIGSTDADPVTEEAADCLDVGSGIDGGPARGPRHATTPQVIDIPAERVARLTAKQLRGIDATDAVDDGGRALGARLRGVGRLVVGLADGDVVTGIDGRATPTADDATGAAVTAYASGEPAAHATVLREGKAWLVTVHIPLADAGVRGAPAARADLQ